MNASSTEYFITRFAHSYGQTNEAIAYTALEVMDQLLLRGIIEQQTININDHLCFLLFVTTYYHIHFGVVDVK